MTHASLFSGIGGFDLAAHWAGIKNIFACEIDEFCRKVLAKRFPETTLYKDIKETKFEQYCGTVDIISGGFPCQPFSVAGKRAGTEDNRYLWGEMLRVVREVKPTWVIAENVRGLTNITGGSTFETVCNDLEVSGYEVQPFIIPALTVGAPHKRERVWIVANRNSTRESQPERIDKNEWRRTLNSCGKYVTSITPYPESLRHGRRGNGHDCDDRERFIRQDKQDDRNEIRCETAAGYEFNPSDTDIRIRGEDEIQTGRKINDVCNTGKWYEHWAEAIARIYGMDDGLPGGMDRLEQRYKDRSRKFRIKAMGNAIVPQIAYQIFVAIITTEVNR